MEMEDYWEPALPISPGAIGLDDQQQLLWGFPEFSWSSPVVVSTFWCANTGMSGFSGGGHVRSAGG